MPCVSITGHEKLKEQVSLKIVDFKKRIGIIKNLLNTGNLRFLF